MRPLRTSLLLACLLLLAALCLPSGVFAQAASTPNRVLRLDGDGDYVQLPSNIFDDLQQATVEAWVKWDSFGWNDQWFGYGSMSLYAVNTRAQLAFDLYDRHQEQHSIAATTNLGPGHWIHMAAVSGPGGMRLYLNGFEVARNDFTGSFAALDHGDMVVLGRHTGPDQLGFMGEIDEVRVWGSERSAAQLRANLHRRLRGDEEGLVALWNFDGACAPDAVVTDHGDRGHHGRLAGEAHCPEVDLPDHLAEPLTVRGRVLDEDGTPQKLAVVRLYLDGEVTTMLYRNQAKGGHYQFWVFEPGPYDLMATYEEHGVWRQGVAAAPGDRAQAVDVVLRPAISLQGRALHLDGTPLHNIIVEALDADGRIEQKVQSDEEGHIRFIQLRPGTYAVRLHLPDRYVYIGASHTVDDAGDAARFRVEQGRTAAMPTVRLAPIRGGTFRIYGALDGLKANAIVDIASAPDGTLWLATAGTGAWTFDGETFGSLTAADGLPHDEVNDVEIAADGAVWLATKGGVARYKDGRLTTLTTADGLNEVTAIHQTPDGALWLATGGGVVRVEGDDFAPMAQLDSALAGARVNQIYQSRDGSLWFATELMGLWRYLEDRIEQFHMRHGLGSPIVESVLEAGDGTLWVGMDNGLARSDGAPLTVSGSRFDNFFGFYTKTVHIVDRYFTDFHQARDGALWFATERGGVVRSDGERFVQYTTRDGLAHYEVGAIGEDFQGGLWFGSADGRLTRYDAGSVVHYGPAAGLGAGQVNALLAAPEGGLWLGTDQGVWRLRDGVFAWLEQPPPVPRVGSLILSEGELWYSVPDGFAWIYRYDGTDVRWFNFDPVRRLAPYQGIIHDLHLAPDGRVWAASRGGVLYMESDAVETDFDSYGMIIQQDGLPSIPVTAVEGDGDGMLYFGTNDGLVLYDGEQLAVRTTADGLVSDRITVLRTDPEGDLWIGTGGGLSRYDGADFSSYTERDGLPHSRVEDIAADESGRRWVATYGGGVAIFDGDNWSAIDVRDGLGDNRVKALWPNEDGSVWLGTERGLTRYVPDAVVPRVHIASARTDSLYRQPEHLPDVVAGSRLVIDYGAVDFKTHPAKRQYRYRLVGRDENWRTATTDNHFEWTPEQAGDYVFEVQAIDRDLNYSPSARLSFAVVLPWYGNPWIVVPGGGFFLGLMGLALFSSARYYRTRKEAQSLREQMFEQERAAREQLEASNAQLTESYEQTQQAREQAERAAEEAEAARQAAESANQAKSAFLANMSHELRTPLNAILGFAQLLTRSTRIEGEERENLHIIHRSGGHLLALINDVLEMAKIEVGRTVLEATRFDLHRLLDDVDDLFRLRAQNKGLALDYQRSKELPRYIFADETKLRQVLINLLGNAVKFTDEGAVTLRAAGRATEGQTRLSFEIEDTGPGIAEEEQAGLFDAFVQSESGRRQSEGTGLGLAISQQFAELMGGQIRVESRVGEGAMFRVEVSVEAVAAAEVAAEEVPRQVIGLAPDQPSYRLLIVEDGADNRRLLRSLLESLHFELREAAHGEEGVEVWRAWRPELIWMDLRMPVMDGYAATKAIRATPGGEQTKIIALTASAFEEDRQKVLDVGCDDFVRKPFAEADIFDALSRHLGVRFVYADEEPVAESALTAADLVGLPPELIAQLGESARNADDAAIVQLLQQVGEDHAALAGQLSDMASQFRFVEIIALTKAVDEE